MSILIPNMTMPKDCDECPLRWPHLAHCSITGKSTSHYPTGKEIHGKPNYCPLEDTPSIDIVFCRDCHWSRPRSLPGETGYRCVLHRIWKGENGFCDSGDRKEGE